MLRRTRATNFFDEDTAFFLAHSQKASSSDCSRIIRCFFLSSGVKDDSSPSSEKILFNLMIASVYLSLGLPPMCSSPRMSPRTSERLIRPYIWGDRQHYFINCNLFTTSSIFSLEVAKFNRICDLYSSPPNSSPKSTAR